MKEMKVSNKYPNVSFKKRFIDSKIIGASVALPVDGDLPLFEKNGPGLTFQILMANGHIQERFGTRIASLLKASGSVCSEAQVIGQYKESSPYKWLPIIDDEELKGYVWLAVKAFLQYIDSMGNWHCFADFLNFCSSYDINLSRAKRKQYPFDYYWLTSRALSSKSVFNIGLDDGIGIYIKPENSVLLIYSSLLSASLAAESYSQKEGVSLQPGYISCLGCYLYGAVSTVGKQRLSSAILDDQWNIEFQTCADRGCRENHPKDSFHHFRISNKGCIFQLIGCESHGTNPRWILEEK